jgi:uncharacterized membrane protein YphA (DoxX/SURF4 family)
MQHLYARFDRMDLRITGWLSRYSIPILRIGMGIVFLWFGGLKFFPGLSPAQDLAVRTIDLLSFGIVPPHVSLVLLATLECAIGLGLITGTFLRLTLLLLAFQMSGTLAPLVLFPREVFDPVLYAPTLEGQYIIKNVVLIGAGLVIGATVRGGRIVPEPVEMRDSRRIHTDAYVQHQG